MSSIQERISDKDVDGRIIVLGLPWDENSSFLQGSAKGPDQIRKIRDSGMSGLESEAGVNLENHPDILDLGNLDVPPGEDGVWAIRKAAQTLVSKGARLLALGGDHSVTHPLVLACFDKWPALGILHFDAHPDLYHEFGGNKYSHACPFARIMESNPGCRLIQVGIRATNAHLRAQAKRFNVVSLEMTDPDFAARIAFDGPVYITLDLDGLDPAFAPGVSHHEPGGLFPRQVLDIIQNLPNPVVGADIVELNPDRDVSDITAALGFKFYKELLAKMVTS